MVQAALWPRWRPRRVTAPSLKERTRRDGETRASHDLEYCPSDEYNRVVHESVGGERLRPVRTPCKRDGLWEWTVEE